MRFHADVKTAQKRLLFTSKFMIKITICPRMKNIVEAKSWTTMSVGGHLVAHKGATEGY